MLHEAVKNQFSIWKLTMNINFCTSAAEGWGAVFSLWVLRTSILPVWSATTYLLVNLMYSLYCVWMFVCWLQDGLVCALEILWIKSNGNHDFWDSLCKLVPQIYIILHLKIIPHVQMFIFIALLFFHRQPTPRRSVQQCVTLILSGE